MLYFFCKVGRQNHKETLAIAKMLSTLTKQLLFAEVLQKATVTKYNPLHMTNFNPVLKRF